MSQKSSVPPTRVPAEKLVRDIRRATRKHHSAEDKSWRIFFLTMTARNKPDATPKLGFHLRRDQCARPN
jgi:hypothetical protein